MAQNPFLERTVRVQAEREHRVSTPGPYRWVRHPMYAGMTFLYLGMPLLLGSALTLAPLGALAVLLAWRSVREERVLLRDLPGYAAYAERTRWRLFPGLF